ncbi:hypothetical protein FD755_003213 [Muntiacus reevesi]|uniref:40S ribosomal protein SA C-terminal domain-containing protein n=1 Tax=Muntiacus reevesi TaxID=9886 RepID=A0A5J5N6E3_MUNRE|nr:hypothetical protein FD755_003213 [Muntiacus reevesi]
MSAVLDVLQMEEGGVLKFLAVGTHLGGTNLDFQMEQYIYIRKSYGKLLLAVCAIVAFENPADVIVLKFVAATGAIPIIGHFSPRTFTNQIQAAFWEPSLPASYINLPTVALCNTDSPLCYVDIAILQEENGAAEDEMGVCSVGLMWCWLQTWEVLCMCGIISWEHSWEVAAEKAVTKEEFQGEWTAQFIYQNSVQQFPTEDWSAQPATAHWSVAPTSQVAEWVGTTMSGLKLFFHKLF